MRLCVCGRACAAWGLRRGIALSFSAARVLARLGASLVKLLFASDSISKDPSR